jgi:hypothetical protein
VKKVVISIVIAVAVVVVVGFVPLMDVPYQATETYYEDEPYEATETYYEWEDLTYEVIDSYEDTGTYLYHYKTQIGDLVWEGTREVPFPIAKVVVRNLDDVPGEFGVSFTFYALTTATLDFFRETYGDDDIPWYMGSTYTSSDSIVIAPGDTGTAEATAQDIDMDEYEWKWEYTVNEPTKQVEMERTVTKYRQVEKQRSVTHYKKGSIFEYLRSRFSSS